MLKIRKMQMLLNDSARPDDEIEDVLAAAEQDDAETESDSEIVAEEKVAEDAVTEEIVAEETAAKEHDTEIEDELAETTAEDAGMEGVISDEDDASADSEKSEKQVFNA